MKILVMGLPGAGKTHLAERLVKFIENCAWFNADVIRKAANDWDFSPAGRIRQAKRMKAFSDFEVSEGRNVVCDFVAPTKQARDEFGADLIIWLDTIKEGRFEDTNKMFERPEVVDYIIDRHLSDFEIGQIGNQIQNKIVRDMAWKVA